MLKCFACGVEKDMTVLEVSRWHKEDHLTDEPIPPLHVIECQSEYQEPGTGFHIFKACVICLECHHKLEPDMWICEDNWKRLNPVVPFERLPITKDDINTWGNPESYKDVIQDRVM